MKTKVLLTVTALVLLAGCQKFGGVGTQIRFSAVTVPEPRTKTAYTGDRTGGPERINWVVGDKIRIYSSEAACNNDGTYHWADYQVSTITTPSAQYSKASTLDVVHSTRGGLAWEGDGTYNFYSIYPAPSADEAAPGTVRGTSGTPFACTIPAAQTGTATTVEAIVTGANTTVYYPSMENAYLVAYDSQSNGNDITLDFEPAYTAFHISAGAGSAPETAKEIKSVTLTSASTALNGAYTAYYNSDWNYGITGTGLATTFTFTGGNYTIPVEGKVEFVIFALPQQLGGLTLTFTLADDTTRSLKLKKNTPDAGTDASGFINFAPCKKHYISGLLIPGSVWTVDDATPVVLRESVAPWDDNAQNPAYGTDLVVNASGLDEVNLSTHSYRFSIYEPEGKTWKIKVLNSSGAVVPGVTITRVNHPGTTDPTSGNGELTGTIRKGNAAAPGLIEFSLSGSTGGSNCTLSFSVVADEKEYSINSEVVRGTWGTGYQYINLP